jgi:hypothetical protein
MGELEVELKVGLPSESLLGIMGIMEFGMIGETLARESPTGKTDSCIAPPDRVLPPNANREDERTRMTRIPTSIGARRYDRVFECPIVCVIRRIYLSPS